MATFGLRGAAPGRSPGELLEEVFGLAPDRWLRRMPGRETFLWPGREELVVKRIVGGEVRDYWHEKLRGGARSAGRREAENLRELAADGVPVPRALLWVDEVAAARHPRLEGRAGRSAVVMERVPHQETLRHRLARADAAERRRWLERLAELVAHLHGRGWYHRDLYLQHVVLASGQDGESLCLLDVGRARRASPPRRRWLVKDLAALLHSAPRAVTRAERLRFLRAWLAARGVRGRASSRRWTTLVLDKAVRLAAHAPRHADPGGAR